MSKCFYLYLSLIFSRTTILAKNYSRFLIISSFQIFLKLFAEIFTEQILIDLLGKKSKTNNIQTVMLKQLENQIKQKRKLKTLKT